MPTNPVYLVSVNMAMSAFHVPDCFLEIMKYITVGHK